MHVLQMLRLYSYHFRLCCIRVWEARYKTI